MEYSLLKNKNVLLLAPSFFSYERKIKESMEKMGATVYLYDERSISSSISKALLKVSATFFAFKTKKYYKKILNECKSIVFDYVLIIRCDMLSKQIIISFKKAFPSAKFCLYLYDSKKNVKGIENKIPLFDFVSSFDMKDCKNDFRLHFRPLFYSDEFLTKKDCFVQYDLCFCGTIHSDRYKIIKKIKTDLLNNGLTFFNFMYLPSHFMYYYYKLFKKSFRCAKKSDFSYSKKTMDEISMIENHSNVVLDIQHPRQTGLTMRTIEMLASRKKIITTNRDIIKYDFYDKRNIMVIDRNNPTLDFSFFNNEFVEIPSPILEKYSLEYWVLDVLGENL